MSVKEYKQFDHGGGFVGFRVSRTIGSNSDYRQAYFSTNKYRLREAKKMAYELDRKWEAEANEIKAKARREFRKKKGAGKHIITDGLRAYISVDKKIRASEARTYFCPCFMVKKPGQGQADITFRIQKHGFHGAYVKAAREYCRIHGLSKNENLSLIALMPDRSLFTDYLLRNLRKRGHKLSKKALLEKLD